MKRTGLCMALLAVLSTSPGVSDVCSSAGCPAWDLFIAGIDPEHSTWERLHRLFLTFPGCDDGVYAEGYSDFVARSLARHWDRLDELKALTSSDKGFSDFVLRHIDASADLDDIALLLSNAQDRCPAESSSLCSAIIQAAHLALKDTERRGSRK